MIEITRNQLFANVNGQLQPLGVVGASGNASPQSGFVHDVVFGSSAVRLDEGHLVSDFSNTKYVAVPTDYAIDYSKSFEIGVYFKASALNKNCALVGTGVSNKFWYFPSVEFQPVNTRIWFGMSSNGSSWGQSFSLIDMTFETDTWYFVKVGNDDGNGKPYIMFTEDFVSWESRIYENDSITQRSDTTNMLIFGGNGLKADLAASNVTIDFDKTYIKNDGTVIWGRENSSL